MEGAGGENDLSFGTKGLRAAIGRTHHAPRAAALQQDLPDDGVRADAEIGPRPRGIDERVRGARPLAPVDVPVEGAEPFLLIAVDVLRHGKARRGARFDEGPAERIFHSEANRGQRTAAAAPGVFAPAVALAAPEVRQDLGIGPAGRAFLGPTLVVEGMAPDVGHAVDRGRPAEPLAARLKDAPTCEMPLRHRVVAPVPRAAFEVRSHGRRHAYRPVIRPSPGLDEQHPEIGVFAQTRREDATSGPGAHDDVVELGHGRTRWSAVVGILRAMAGATDPASCRASNRPTHSAAHLDSRCGRPMSPWTLWNTRGVAHGRFRLADARIHRPGLTAAATSAAPLR